MLIISLIRSQTINKKPVCLILDPQGIISNFMLHIDYQQTWDHTFIFYAHMDKPCYQVNPVYLIFSIA